MPLYEFSCGDCGAQFESIQSFSAATTPNCPVCDSSNVTRLLSRPAIHFKGSGWYITDSKNSGKQSASGNGRNGNGDASSAAEKSKESTSGESSDASASTASTPTNASGGEKNTASASS